MKQQDGEGNIKEKMKGKGLKEVIFKEGCTGSCPMTVSQDIPLIRPVMKRLTLKEKKLFSMNLKHELFCSYRKDTGN